MSEGRGEHPLSHVRTHHRTKQEALGEEFLGNRWLSIPKTFLPLYDPKNCLPEPTYEFCGIGEGVTPRCAVSNSEAHRHFAFGFRDRAERKNHPLDSSP